MTHDYIKFQPATEAAEWFEKLRNKICANFLTIEDDFSSSNSLEPSKFIKQEWQRPGGGGGIMSVMRGNVFEKVGVNISTVYGELDPKFRTQIPGTEQSGDFYATGISVVAHPTSPLIPATHFNTRFISTAKSWYGGGADLTPIYSDINETKKFHQALQKICDDHDSDCYEKYKKQCDEYFHLTHRDEARGVGGIFFDYLNITDNVEFNEKKNHHTFKFVKAVGETFSGVYTDIVRTKMNDKWNAEQREYQLYKRGRYVEFNLLFDRGTKFGLMTGGNVDAILMSLPPLVKW